MIVRSRAPLRLGLAGGGTDVSPYCDTYGGEVLNATISIYAHAELTSVSDQVTILRSLDLDCCMRLEPGTELVVEPALRLHYAVYREMMARYNHGQALPLALSTYCDIPAGSGLGSSSTLVVAMIHAIALYLELTLDQHEMASLAFYIERVVCGFHGGRQDQFAATWGGFNFMEFSSQAAARIHPLLVPQWMRYELEASMILYYMGISRASADIINDQSSNIRHGNSVALAATHALKDEVKMMKACLLGGDFGGIVETMRSGWANKKQLAHSVSNSRIDTIYDAALAAGALAGKVSGAGGGGFMMFLAPPGKRHRVLQTLTQFGGQISPCHFEMHGSQAWRVADLAPTRANHAPALKAKCDASAGVLAG